MIDKALNRLGVGIALALMVAELTYVNAKSLLFMVDEFAFIDRTFSVIGSLAFSMVTVIVMRKSRERWPKLVFPVFDAALVFFGFNLKFADNLLANPVAFGLSIFFALFTGLITYSLGIINSREHEQQSDARLDEYRAKCSNAENALLQTESKLVQFEARVHQYAADLQQANEALQQTRAGLQQKEMELVQMADRLQQLEKLRQQSEAACTCEWCGRIFPTEAARRSHSGRCAEKPQPAAAMLRKSA